LAQFTWQYVLNDRQFTLVTEDAGNGAYRIVSVTGSIGGNSITGLGTANTPNNTVYTDAYSAANDGIRGNGITFTLSNGTQYNLEVVSVVSSTPGGGFIVNQVVYETIYNADGTQISTAPADYTYSTNAPMPCFVAGTQIATEGGEVAVEQLAVDDIVMTADSDKRRVIWIGKTTIRLGRRNDPERVLPIRIKAHSVAANVPHRDLLVSPGHAVHIGGHAVDAIDLVNGTTVTQERMDVVDYYHVEVETPSWLVADGLAAESFADVGSRSGLCSNNVVAFDAAMLPESSFRVAEPVKCGSAALTMVRGLLAQRAHALGWSLETAPPPVIVTDGASISAVAAEGNRYWFVLPGTTDTFVIGSTAARPADILPSTDDRRQIGIMVAGLRVNGVDILIDAPALKQGFYGVEQHDGVQQRWTDGAALVEYGQAVHVVELWVTDCLPTPVLASVTPARLVA
jgi:hypothetical protein